MMLVKSLEEVIEMACQYLPINYIVSLCMENGSAYVELVDINNGEIILPDSADKSLVEQIVDAIGTANGFRYKK